jgi:hypothetical protein
MSDTENSEQIAKKIWTRLEIDAILIRSDAAVERAIVHLYRFQTNSEQATGQTTESNKRGFNATSSVVGTRFARWLLGMDDNNLVKYPCKSLNHEKAKSVFKRYLSENTPTPMSRARQIALLHSQQIVDIANGVFDTPNSTFEANREK